MSMVIIDSPDFTHRVARARAERPIPPFRSSIMSRPPSGRGGRAGRARMRRYVDHVLALLPFEPEGAPGAGWPALHLCRPSAGRAN